MDGLSQEGATVVGTAVGFHFLRPASLLGHRAELGSGRLTDRGLHDGRGLRAGVALSDRVRKAIDEHVVEPEHLHERVLDELTSRAFRE